MTVTHFFPVVALPFMVWNQTAAVHNIDSAAEVVPERAVTPSPRVPRSLSTTGWIRALRLLLLRSYWKRGGMVAYEA